MNAKNITIAIIVLVLLGGAYWYVSSNKQSEGQPQTQTQDQERITPTESNDRIAAPTTTAEPASEGKLKVANFSGKLEKVDVGCFADGECFVVVDGKHITTTMGWSRETVGTVQGVEGFGDLEKHIGEEVEVYAQDKGDGTYTLYGSEGFYVKLK